MALADLNDWLDEQTKPGIVWYIKRLSGNDTYANGAHQAGPYIQREFILGIFPSINKPDIRNPDTRFAIRIDSHADAREVRVVWYNNKITDQGTRNETRITNFGGSSSALLDAESTGALTIFAFHRAPGFDAGVCHVWVCNNAIEEDFIEERLGPVEPGIPRIWSVDEPGLLSLSTAQTGSCRLAPENIPPAWLARFPTGMEIVRKTVELRPANGLQNVDKRLMKRRECEFEIFRSVEEALELPIIQQGFTTIEDFITRAQTILQRRKARSGHSLELHTREIFIEEHLQEGRDFAHQPESESGKRPDFLFPSETAYKNPNFPVQKLKMLAVKTTCKDRWRQILNEANRIQEKHLLTLQEGVSETQFREMQGSNVKLVVPASLIGKYPELVRPNLQTFESFIADVRLILLM